MKAHLLQTVDYLTAAFWALFAAFVCAVLLLGFFPSASIGGIPAAPHIPQALLDNQGTCWTGSDKPLVKWPGAAVVRDLESGDVVYTKDKIVVDVALNNVFATLGLGGTVSDKFETVALCI